MEIDQIQANIIQVVNDYKMLYPDEYSAVVAMVKENRDKMFSDVGGMQKGIDFIERPLLEYPETLSEMMQKRLGTDELVYLFGSGKEGVRWFARTFREFSLVSKI